MNVRNVSSKSTATDIGITLLRLGLGGMWLAHALLKLFVYTLPGTAQFFASVGYPGFLAYPVFVLEVLGGLALVLGIYARQVSLALVPVMAAAAWVHVPNGWVFTSSGGGWEYPVF
jgi:putative oxidoreductase